jgi:hypothetical protein
VKLAERLAALETLQQRRRLRSCTPVYTIINEGEPRPDVDGPVYRLVSARSGEAADA